MHAAISAFRVELWRQRAALDGVTVASDFGAIVRSARLVATMRGNLDAGGVIVAALRGDTLVGYATTIPVAALASPEAAPLDRWHDLPDALALGAVEVARASRRGGVATALLRRLVRWPELERRIVLAHGLASHWDVDAAGLGYYQYRAMLVRLVSRAGFALQATDDPDVRESPVNFLAARVGADVPVRSVGAMVARLFLDR